MQLFIDMPQGNWRSLELHKHHSALGLASSLKPVQPVTLIRPHAARRAARFFVEKFPGKSIYAVKANPSPDLIALLWDSGITHFDVASIAEVTRRRFKRYNEDKLANPDEAAEEQTFADERPDGADETTGAKRFAYPPQLFIVDGG